VKAAPARKIGVLPIILQPDGIGLAQVRAVTHHCVRAVVFLGDITDLPGTLRCNMVSAPYFRVSFVIASSCDYFGVARLQHKGCRTAPKLSR
jgi:hypothetical protein